MGFFGLVTKPTDWTNIKLDAADPSRCGAVHIDPNAHEPDFLLGVCMHVCVTAKRRMPVEQQFFDAGHTHTYMHENYALI